MVIFPICTAVIKNTTDRDLYNFEFIWLAKPNFSIKVKKIKKGNFQRAAIPTIILNGTGSQNQLESIAPLKMYYTDENNYRNEYTILEELEGLRERLICINILGLYEDGRLKYEVDPKYDSSF